MDRIDFLDPRNFIQLLGALLKLEADLKIWIAILAFLHVLICIVVFKGVLIFCGDSDFYLSLSDHWYSISPDRPSGFSILLGPLQALAHLLGISFAYVAIPFTHGLAVACLALCAITVLRGIENKKQRLMLLGVLSLAFFAPATLLFHSTVLMPDSITLCLTLVVLCAAVSPAISPGTLLAASFVAGILCIVRNGQVAYSSVLCLGLLANAWMRKRRTLSIGVLVCFLAVPTWYSFVLIKPSFGKADFGFLGGRTLMARIIPSLNCEQITRLAGSEAERTSVARLCLPADSKMPEWQQLWTPNSLLERIDRDLHSTRFEANGRYQRWASKGMLLFPAAYLRAGARNLKEALQKPVSYNFKMLRPLEVGESCSLFAERLWNIPIWEYLTGWNLYQTSNHFALTGFDFFTAVTAAALNLLSFLTLLWPLVPRFGWPRFRHDPHARVAYLLALASGLVLFFGCYYVSRYMQFFQQLAFFQFAVMLAGPMRRAPEVSGEKAQGEA